VKSFRRFKGRQNSNLGLRVPSTSKRNTVTLALDGREHDSSRAGNFNLPCSIVAWSNDDFSDVGAFAGQHGFH
jgi:hypothetical protein